MKFIRYAGVAFLILCAPCMAGELDKGLRVAMARDMLSRMEHEFFFQQADMNSKHTPNHTLFRTARELAAGKDDRWPQRLLCP